ncbi:MAG: DsbA family oxidoreductase [Congregibacter sp.]
MTHTPHKIQLDIVSDIVCPWCLIGFLQLQKALNQMRGRFEIQIHWRPFELNPQMAEAGENLREHLVRKLGPAAGQGTEVRDRLTSLGRSLGFEFDFFDDMRVANTFRAHQLLHWAKEYDRENDPRPESSVTTENSTQTALKLGLFAAHFALRENINDPKTLFQIATNAGLPAEQVDAVLRDEIYAKAVRTEEQLWLERDIHAVPAFVFDERYSVLGAQDAENFTRVLSKLESRQASVIE